MFDPIDEIIQLDPLGMRLERLMARLPPGTPEFQAAYSACQALRRARNVIASSPRFSDGRLRRT